MDNNEESFLEEVFAKPNYKFHIRELARLTKLNPNTIINIAKNLERQGIIKKINRKHIVEISLNLEDKKTQWRRKLFNLKQVYNSGLTDFLIEKYSPNSISLIGSYSRGEDIENSDIDIVIFSSKKLLLDLSAYEKKLRRKIHLIFPEKSISDEFFNNLINGVVLYGAIRK